MLKLVEKKAELDFLPASPFTAVITSLCETYGLKTDFAHFYVQGHEAALSSLDGNINIYASKEADFEELSQFLKVLGFSSIRGEISVINALGFEISDGSYIVRKHKYDACRPENFVDSFDNHKIYELLKFVGFAGEDYGAFAADVYARLNKGTASFGGIAENGELMSCCFKLFIGSESILLGAVATAETARGRGLASSLVPYMAQGNKPSFLLCRVDSLVEFYKNCGFEECGRWALSVCR